MFDIFNLDYDHAAGIYKNFAIIRCNKCQEIQVIPNEEFVSKNGYMEIGNPVECLKEYKTCECDKNQLTIYSIDDFDIFDCLGECEYKCIAEEMFKEHDIQDLNNLSSDDLQGIIWWIYEAINEYRIPHTTESESIPFEQYLAFFLDCCLSSLKNKEKAIEIIQGKPVKIDEIGTSIFIDDVFRQVSKMKTFMSKVSVEKDNVQNITSEDRLEVEEALNAFEKTYDKFKQDIMSLLS